MVLEVLLEVLEMVLLVLEAVLQLLLLQLLLLQYGAIRAVKPPRAPPPSGGGGYKPTKFNLNPPETSQKVEEE